MLLHYFSLPFYSTPHEAVSYVSFSSTETTLLSSCLSCTWTWIDHNLWTQCVQAYIQNLPHLPRTFYSDRDTCTPWLSVTTHSDDDHEGGNFGDPGEETYREGHQFFLWMMRTTVMWILKTKEKHGIPQSSMEKIIQDVGSFLQLVLGEVHSAVNSVLHDVFLPVNHAWHFSTRFHFWKPIQEASNNVYSWSTDNFGSCSHGYSNR